MADNSGVVFGKEPVPNTAGGALARLEDVLVVRERASSDESNIDAPKRIGLLVAGLVFGVFGMLMAAAKCFPSARQIALAGSFLTTVR